MVRTRAGVKPVYVSIGHMIDLPSAIRWVLDCCRGYRLPEPTRLAHQAAGGNLRVKMVRGGWQADIMNYYKRSRKYAGFKSNVKRPTGQNFRSPGASLTSPVKKKRLPNLKSSPSAPDFWLDKANAQNVMRQLAEKNRTVQRWRGLEKRLADIAELMALSAEDDSLSGGDRKRTG